MFGFCALGPFSITLFWITALPPFGRSIVAAVAGRAVADPAVRDGRVRRAALDLMPDHGAMDVAVVDRQLLDPADVDVVRLPGARAVVVELGVLDRYRPVRVRRRQQPVLVVMEVG